MKIIFNDATELTIQSASIRAYGSLLIKTISATEEELRTMFQDKFKTQKMTVTERESTIAEYEIHGWNLGRSDVPGKRITNGSY